MSKVLQLPMKKKWFDMILSGEKKEEYREFKPYWMTRVKNCIGECSYPHSSHKTKDHGREDSIVVAFSRTSPFEICFINGYQKNARRFMCPCISFVVRNEAIHPEWGEGTYAGKPHFVFNIGHIKKGDSL